LAKKIKRQLEIIKPDVIHIQDTYILPAAVMANKDLKIPSVATIRNSVLDKTWELMFKKPISTLLKRRNKTIIKALNNLDCIVSVSDYIKSELIDRGVDSKKVVTIYNLPPTFPNIAPQIRDPTDEKVHLFAPGLLASFKGFTVLVQAMKTVVEENPKVDLTIAGDGPQKITLQKMVKRLGLEEHVTFAGKIPFEKLGDYYSRCDVVIFPSVYAEPFGRVALEAMYFQKPVIASHVGGIPEVVKNYETGLLVAKGDPNNLSIAILNLIQNHKLREAISNNAKIALTKNFSPSLIMAYHTSVYEKVHSKQYTITYDYH
jgi:glycosyltransferase involved in cell wall biosynthesis